MGLNNTNNKEFDFSEAVSASGKGFSLDSYRNVNMVRIYLYKNDSDPIPIFKAYYKGNFGYNLALRTGDFGSVVKDFMNDSPIGSVISRSIMKSVSSSLNLQSLSGAFDMPVKPFIKGTEPLSFSLNCFLPLIERGDGTDTFKSSIQDRIDTLTGVVLPWRHKQGGDVANAVSDAVDSAISWLFDDTDSTFWKAVQNTIKGLKEDFVDGIYVLSEPIQFDRGNKLVVRIGPWRLDGVFIEKVVVSYSPLIYTDGSNVYPSFANVTVECKTLKPATPESVGVQGNKDQFISNYINGNRNKW